MPGTALTPTNSTATQTPRWIFSAGFELLLIIIATAALRAYATWQTPLISRDGMLYIGMARMINHGLWLEQVGDWFLFNPYPALIALLNRWGIDFDFAGQLISAVTSTLAVIPLYLWCRKAFDRRVAQLAALTYTLHPVLLRYSGQVLREGLYWCLMLWAVYAFWLAARQPRWWKFTVAGVLTTCAALTRMEGAAVFGLGALWALSLSPQNSDGETLWSAFRPRLRPLLQSGVAAMMFPLTIIILNMIFVPAGQGWHGGGRWLLYVSRLTTGQEVAPKANKVADRMVELVAAERARTAELPPQSDDVRDLARSLPAWNPFGEPDPKVLRLQRFLILADDQRRFLFIGRFINECWEGLLFPCVICCLWGLWSCRTTVWSPRRDLPVVALSAVLTGLLFYHLATEFILEPRYMFCLIPLVFPWSGVGARDLYQRLTAWYAQRPARAPWRPSGVSLCAVLMVLAMVKLQLGLEDRGKVIQKELGERLRSSAAKRLKIAGPESLKRIGHYAEADYFIIPRGDLNVARKWLDSQPLDLVILTPDDMPVKGSGALLPVKSLRYRQWSPEEARAGKIQVYSVQPQIRQLGS